jgi:hypothetical protein
MDRRFGDWRVLADEYEHENWLDENDTDVLDAVLDAVLVRGASFCPILLTVVNERREKSKPQALSPICCVFRAIRPAAGLIAAYCGTW